MKDRRSLAEGLKSDPELQQMEEAFVFGSKRPAAAVEIVESAPIADVAIDDPPEIKMPPKAEQKILPQFMGRVPVTTRCRPEVASALKRASLQRQLDGVEPYYVQDIMEIALEDWLKAKGYIS